MAETLMIDLWLTLRQHTRRKVIEALEGPDVEKTEKGEVALHGHTVWAFSTAIPGAPLKEGG